MAELERSWKVGELARATGVTIRALHHYDEIGLLVPGRTESGHRVYLPADVERLYRVLALRGIGLSLDEIAAALDDEQVGLVDTVRRHVASVEREIDQRQRLLERLREMLAELERSARPSIDALIGTVEAMSVVEATVEEILTREPWEALWELRPPTVVLLRESGGERVLPIWIGEPEAAALVMQRRGMKAARPMTPDLMVALLDAAGARVERVVVERLDGNTFFATITVAGPDEPREVDARPSDALNVALRTGAPVQVASDLMIDAGAAGWLRAPERAAEGPDAPPWKPLEPLRPPQAPRYLVGEDAPPVLRAAAAQARVLGHGVVNAPHLLLGLLADATGSAAALLAGHRVTLAAARAATEERGLLPQRPPQADAPLPLGSRAAVVMHTASLQARLRGGEHVESLHVLLALVNMPDARAMPGLGDVDLDVLRADVRSALDDGAS